jgi:eukaryotic-like serine/threonine-protein kinase
MSTSKLRESGHLYEFGVFRLDPQERTFARNGQRMPLAPKAFDTLLILVERSGRVVRKDELLRSLWPDSFVEENNLTQHISALRRALGTEPGEYIETVPKLGYRFVCPVREVGEDGPVPLGAGETEVVVSRRTRTHIVLREEIEEEEDSEEDTTAVARTSPHSVTATIAGQRSPAVSYKQIATLLGLVIVAIAGTVLFLEVRSRHGFKREVPSATLPAAAQSAPHKSVAVLGFRNLSQRPADAWLSGALAEMLATELASGGQLRLVSGEQMQRIKADLKLDDGQALARPTLEQIRDRSGADMIVSGSYTEAGSGSHTQLRLDLELQDAVSGERVFSTGVSGKPEELFSLVSRGGAELRAKLGEPELTGTEGAQAQAALPATPEAARFYSQGIVRLRMFDAPEAERLLSNAVAVDPGFALGHSALASAWSALGYDERAMSEARRALDLSQNLPRQEHLLIAGQYSELNRDWDHAVASYQELFADLPDDVDYGLHLASAQTSAGKGNDALATIQKLHSLPAPSGHDPRIDLAQAESEDSLGDFIEELNSANRAIRSGTELGEQLLVARAFTKKGWALRRLGQTSEAIAGLLEAKKNFAEAGDLQGVGTVMRLLGGTQQEQGDFAKAKESFNDAIAIFRRIGDRRGLAMSINGLAIAYYEHNELRTARTLDEQYLEIEEEVGSKINTAGALGNIANVEEAEGNLAEAQRLNEESIKIFTEVGDQRALGTALGNLANELYERGDLAGAAARYNQALAIKRKIGYQRGIAYDLSGLSDVLGDQGKLAAARQAQEQALQIRIQISETKNAAASRLELASLDLEDGRPVDAAKLAAETAQEFEKEKSAADQALAYAVEARSLLTQGDVSGARAALDRARTLTQGLPNPPLRFEIAITSAQVRMAGHAGMPAGARSDLESALAQARKSGYREYALKLEMTLGELDLRSGDSRGGRDRLEALANDAQKSGFLLVARDAEAILSEQPASQK